MVFRDGECRIRKHNAPADFATIKHIASNPMRRAPGKRSMRVKQRLAAWDGSYLATPIAAGWNRSPDSPADLASPAAA
jgi:hypothetical protein